jgi:hypothetical protein
VTEGAHPHPKGHHTGSCTKGCRAGHREHHNRERAEGPVKYDLTDAAGNRIVGTYYPPGDPPRNEGHLYRGASGRRERATFIEGYTREFERQGMSHDAALARARRVYGATVGKVKRERGG